MTKNSYFWLSEPTFEAGFGPGMAGNPMSLILSPNGPNLAIEILVSCWPVLFPASTLYPPLVWGTLRLVQPNDP